MLREKCRTCGSSDVYTGRLFGQSGIVLNSARSWFKGVAATKCLTCVTCGSLEPYLDDKATEKVKAWKASEMHQYGAPQTEGVQPSSFNLVPLMIALAVAGIAAAIAVQMMQVGHEIGGRFGH